MASRSCSPSRSSLRRSFPSPRCRAGSSRSPSTTRSRPWSTPPGPCFSGSRPATASGWRRSIRSPSSPSSPRSRRGATGGSSRGKAGRRRTTTVSLIDSVSGLTGSHPLEGVRVLDLTSSLAGPYCTQILAALGADVIKVEHPGRGDEARGWGPAFVSGGSVIFYAANAGKRSLALDVSTEPGREALLRLAERSAVFVQSLRPGKAERLGLGPAELRGRNDRLIYCSIGAFGRSGPLSDQPGYDPLMQAAGGIMSVTGEPDGDRVRVGTSLIDLGTAVWTALAVLAALLEGRGRVLDLSLYETTLGLLPYQLTNYLATGEIAGREGSAFALIAPYQVFRTRDGELMVVAGNDRLFQALCDVVGLPDLRVDRRFATNPLRIA